MPRRVIITAKYHGDARGIFQQALHFSELADAMSGIAHYDGLPDGPGEQGETYQVDITTFKIFKTKGYEMFIELLDKEGCVLQSREKGGPIKQWDHRLSITQDGDVAIWTDDVAIDAGVLTPLVARFGAFIYKQRHKHRQALSITHQIKI